MQESASICRSAAEQPRCWHFPMGGKPGGHPLLVRSKDKSCSSFPLHLLQSFTAVQKPCHHSTVLTQTPRSACARNDASKLITPSLIGGESKTMSTILKLTSTKEHLIILVMWLSPDTFSLFRQDLLLEGMR